MNTDRKAEAEWLVQAQQAARAFSETYEARMNESRTAEERALMNFRYTRYVALRMALSDLQIGRV